MSARVSDSQPASSAGRHDAAARRRLKRSGKETGGWAYLTGEQLAAAGFSPADDPPLYRVWGGQRGRFVLTLYREP